MKWIREDYFVLKSHEKQIDKNQKSRNMQKRWLNYKVKFVSNVDMHEDIEPDKSRFTLLKKL